MVWQMVPAVEGVACTLIRKVRDSEKAPLISGPSGSDLSIGST
jgi:hypothetical protein